MSETYNRKLEVREKRKHLRMALLLAKKLFAKFSSFDLVSERQIVTCIRNVIRDSRSADLKVENPEDQTMDWFRSLALELLSGVHGKQGTYQKLLDRLSSDASTASEQS